MTYRQDWQDGVCAFTWDGSAPLLLMRQSQDGFINITVAGRAEFSKLTSVWRGITSVLQELKHILQEWPGVIFEEYIVCAHCLKQNEDPPEIFPGDYLYKKCPEGLESVRCPSGLGSLDPSLVYPLSDEACNSSPEKEASSDPRPDVQLSGASSNFVLVAGDNAEISVRGLQLPRPADVKSE